MSVAAWLIMALLIGANALYVAGEFAAVGVRRSRVRRLADDGNWLARRLLPHVEDRAALDRYVGTSQIGITLSSLMLGAYAQATLSLWLAPILERLFALTDLSALSAAVVVVLVVLTAAQLVLGELVPKTLALQYPTGTALATVLPMEWSLVAFRPLLTILNGAALIALRRLGAGDHGHQHLHSPEEIDLLIAESRDGGLLEPEEQQRLRRALHLNRRSAADLMVPRDRLTMIEVSASWNDVLQTVLSSSFSRLPVFRNTRDEIVGVLRVKDVVERYATTGAVPVETLMRPVLQIDASLSADRVLATLRERRAHSAVVVDSDRRALGLVTIQDVLSELLATDQAASADPAAGRAS
ncbi:MAG: HlyC/CorC family transporter [Acidobacteria bacterium]|nr:HlyC/CorC family transporter [Acidobacteriota bacterium]